MIVIILGRERDFETLEFSLQFSLGGLSDERESAEVLAALGKLLESKAGLSVLDEGVPASCDCDRFSSHKLSVMESQSKYLHCHPSRRWCLRQL